MAKPRKPSSTPETRNAKPLAPASKNYDGEAASSSLRAYNIQDFRLEHPDFSIALEQDPDSDETHYHVSGDLSASPPPIRDSRYLTREQSIDIYRWMLLNRRMESVLESLYKQSKVVGGVYFGLGQEGCSCASAYALQKDDWLGPMIRNQGALLVRGFSPADIMRQYMAKADSPTFGRDASSHFGDIVERNVCSPISMLGELIGVMAGVCLGARLQGRNIVGLTYIGDGGQSTGVTYEGLNFAAVQKLGLVLMVENNLWGYSTPADMQFRVKDLAERAVAYGIPGVIIDGTDPCQVYDATHEACERAYRGEGPTLIEAKMMRMKGHAIHDAAQYVPRPLMDYWLKRDPIARFENYLVEDKQWLTREAHDKLVAEVDEYLARQRAEAEASPLPTPEEDAKHQGVYCDPSCHDIKPKYGEVRFGVEKKVSKQRSSEGAVHLK
ncbi:MAG TPA: thiamine pyrophosphate-dependent dehydrogenase E1 component subunit alpha [Clostridia bacterium]|nr:thiamine pyrophosphate-dependent dehydrogenase E1 component subunit alpha [Clostridia bacterium]